MSFEKIAGQDSLVQALKIALAKNRLAHALLFTGPSKCGQRAVAMELAKALFCRNPGENGGCDGCRDCRGVEGLFHPDLFIVEPEEDSRLIKVEAIRKLANRANLKPFQAKKKVFLIDRAQGMNETAQNALLKTLEEPPGDAVFILITSGIEALLPTIRSRVQIFNFQPISGAVEDPETQKLKNTLLDFVLSGAPPATAPEVSKAERDSLAKALDHLILNFRGALVLKAGAEELTGLAGSEDTMIERRLAKQYSAEELTERIELFAQTKENILHSANVRLTLAVLWDDLIYAR